MVERRAVVRLVGTLMQEQDNELAVSRRHMSLESVPLLSNNSVMKLRDVEV